MLAYLPEVEAETNPDTVDEESGPAPRGTGQRGLVVEDNIEVGRPPREILEDLGDRPDSAANAKSGVERLGADGGGFELMFSDVVMPSIGGLAGDHGCGDYRSR